MSRAALKATLKKTMARVLLGVKALGAFKSAEKSHAQNDGKRAGILSLWKRPAADDAWDRDGARPKTPWWRKPSKAPFT